MQMYRPTTQPPRPSQAGQLSTGEMVEIARTVAEARRFEGQWQALADRALDANPFLEPWCLIPALESYGQDRDICIAFVYSKGESERRLIGVFPLEQRRKFRGLPLRHLVSWLHPQTFFAQPIIDPQHGEMAWAQLLDWARGQGAQLIELPMVDAASATMAALETTLANRKTKSATIASFKRALLRAGATTAAAYIAAGSSAKSRKSWRRQNRRLGELGRLECRVLGPEDPADPWIEAFLRLEANSWKGHDGTALASHPHEERFFREMAAAAHARKALHMMGLFLDGQPVALQCNLFSGGDGFAFKVTFDAQYSALSPGVLLELAAIEDFFGRDGLRSVDSCTNAGHPLMGRLWSERRQIDHQLVPTGRREGRIICRLFPLAQSIRARLRRKGNTA